MEIILRGTSAQDSTCEEPQQLPAGGTNSTQDEDP